MSSRLILDISCLGPGISHLSKDLGSSYWRIGPETKGVRCAHGQCGNVNSTSSNRQHKETYAYTDPCLYTHTFINVSICNHLCPYQANHEFRLILPTLIHHHTDHSSLLPLLIGSTHSNSEKLGSYHPWSIYFPVQFQ